MILGDRVSRDDLLSENMDTRSNICTTTLHNWGPEISAKIHYSLVDRAVALGGREPTKNR